MFLSRNDDLILQSSFDISYHCPKAILFLQDKSSVSSLSQAISFAHVLDKHFTFPVKQLFRLPDWQKRILTI